MKLISLILFILLIQGLACKKYSAEYIEAKSKIERLNYFDTDVKSQEILCLLGKVPSTELSYLMLKGNSLEKIYSFWTYVQRTNADYRKYFPVLVMDTTKIEKEHTGCIIGPPTEVGNIIFDIAENKRSGYGIYKTYPEYLDSISIELVEHLGNRGNINCRLLNLNAPENLYSKVREKAMNGNIPALIGLSGYMREQDISIIKKYLKPDSRVLFYGLACVEKFPHVNFEIDILEIYYSKMNQKHPLIFNYVCQILRKYKSINTENAFNELISNPKKYYYQIIELWHSFEKKEYNHPLRRKIIEKLGKSELERRQTEYRKMDYWQIARAENEY